MGELGRTSICKVVSADLFIIPFDWSLKRVGRTRLSISKPCAVGRYADLTWQLQEDYRSAPDFSAAL